MLPKDKRTWLGWLNFIVLQWFFIRLSRDYRGEKLLGYSINGLILPTTGYGSPYVYLIEFSFRILKVKETLH